MGIFLELSVDQARDISYYRDTDETKRENMKEVKVIGCGWSSDPSEVTMGTMVDRGVLVKKYIANRWAGSPDIEWKNISTDTIVVTEYDRIAPGETCLWEK